MFYFYRLVFELLLGQLKSNSETTKTQIKSSSRVTGKTSLELLLICFAVVSGFVGIGPEVQSELCLNCF